MGAEPRWIRWLFRIAGYRASDAALGDIAEQLASGRRGTFWAIWQVLSTLRPSPSPVVVDASRERGPDMWSNLVRDIRYTLRTFRRSPAFAVTAIVPIALGIGINTGVFSMVNSLAFRSLPVPGSTDLVTVYQTFEGVKKRRVHGARIMFSMPEYRAYRDGARTLSGVAAYTMAWSVTLGGQAPQELEGTLVTCNYFDVLQVRPAIGAGFTAANCEAPGAPPAVVLGHALWTRTFNADPEIIHRTISLNGQSVAVVGVAPEGFEGIDLTKAGFFASTSLQAELQEQPQTSWLTLIGRRGPGVDLSQARAELAVIAGQIDRQQPGRTTTLSVTPSSTLALPHAREEVLTAAAVIMGAVGLVLLIACANVGNVLLARAAGRTREIAVRLSLGAGRGRLIRQLLTESLTIALTGGIAGSLLAWWSFQMLLVRLPQYLGPEASLPRVDVQPDLNVLAFGLGLTLLTAIVCGLVPAIQASKPDLHATLKTERTELRGRTAAWLRSALIAVQIAVCMVLLISAGLLLRALHAAYTVDPGFEYRHVVVTSTAFRGQTFDDARVAAFQQRFLARIESMPGVEAVAHASKIPLKPGRQQDTFRLSREQDDILVDVNHVSAGFFALLNIPIVRGRAFAAADMDHAARVGIVSEATARHYWPRQDPVGRTIFMGSNQEPLEIVGVAKDVYVTQVGETESSYLYVPGGPGMQRRLSPFVRAQGDLSALAKAIQSAAHEIEPDLIVRVDRLEDNVEYGRGRSRVTASLSGVLCLLALVLAFVGVYGVVSYVVNRRRREVGIRLTLGATASNVRQLIVRDTFRPILIGLVIGTAAAAVACQALQSVLFGISPLDPLAFIGAGLFLLTVAGAATMLPTRDALNVDPAASLRCE